jgi:hypothetical protein
MMVMSRSHHDLTGWMASGTERMRRGKGLSGIERAEVHIAVAIPNTKDGDVRRRLARQCSNLASLQ